MLVEHLHHLQEVQQASRQPVDLVDHHAVDPPGPDVGQQPLQRGTLGVAAGESAVVVVLRQADQALALLAGDERLPRFALRIERVELLLEPLFVALAGVDGAADRSVRFGFLESAHD